MHRHCYTVRSIDCTCPDGLEGDCEACEREALESAIETAMLQAEDEGELD